MPIVTPCTDAMHVPVMAPHWVKNGLDVSVSLSMTWRSDRTYAVADTHAFNWALQTTGLNPARPKRYSALNRLKALAWRALRKSGVVKLS